MKLTKTLLFAAGTLFGSAGFKILRSKDAKKLYTKAVATGMRGYDALAKTGQKLQSDFEDVINDAKQINEVKKIEEATEKNELEF